MNKININSGKIIGLIAGLTILLVLIGPVGANSPFSEKIDKANSDLKKVEQLLKGKYAQNEILVRFKSDKKPFRIVNIPEGKIKEKLAEYLKRADIEYAEPNYIAYALMSPNDPYYSYQWHLDNQEYHGINMEAAWDITAGSGVTVAIIDTGIAYENYGLYQQATDLADTCFVAGYDFVYNDNHPNDDNGHGTHIAGTIAQSTNNNLGVAGIAFDACLMPIKALNSYGSGTYADVIEGIYFAADHGAQVINLSLGGEASSQALEDAVAYAYNQNVTIVAAAGNDGQNVLHYPAAYNDYVIAVGATRYDKTRAYYSTYGPSLDLMAPGGDLNVDQNQDGYGDGILQQSFQKRSWRTTWGYYFMQGTSMAAAHVSGAAALIIANNNATNPDGVRIALQETAEDLGSPGRDDIYGYGLINAYAALQFSQEPDSDGDGVADSQDACSDIYGAYCNGCPQPSCSGCQLANCPAENEPICLDDDSLCLASNAVGTCSTGVCSYQCISDYGNCNYDWANGCEINLSSDSNNCGSCENACGTISCPISGCGVGGCLQEEYGTYPNTQQTACATGVCSGQCTATCQYNTDCDTDDDNDGVLDSDDACPNTYGIDCNGCPNLCSGCAIMLCQEGTSNPPACEPGTCPDTACPADGCGVGGCTEDKYGTYTSAGNTCQVVDSLGACTENSCALECIYDSTCQAAENVMHVEDISFTSDVWSWGRWGSWCRVTATVSILDNTDNSVSEANVYGSWSGAYSQNVSGTTDSNGQVIYKTGLVRGCGTFTFTVNDVTKTDWIYNPTANTETSDSITLP